MSQRDKLLKKFLNRPTNFTWGELVRLLHGFGYTETSTGKTGGSRRRFTHKNGTDILLHKPHPGNIVKRYQIDQITDFLRQENFI